MTARTPIPESQLAEWEALTDNAAQAVPALIAEVRALRRTLEWYADAPEPGNFKIVGAKGQFISDLASFGDRARAALPTEE